MALTHVYAEIVKATENDDGTLLVTGKATGPDLDLDKQICDADWLSKAVPDWFSSGANVREQHSQIAAGVGQELAKDGDSWNLSTLVVDPVSVLKVKKGVLKGYSVGIANPKVVKDAAAPGGRIVDGQIVEVSLVDRPANPTCALMLAKSVDGSITQVEELVEDVTKDYSAGQRDDMADAGQAMPDGSYPIKTKDDLAKAIRAVGRGGADHDAIRKHIIARAKALGASDMIPDNWKADGSLKVARARKAAPAQIAFEPKAVVASIVKVAEAAHAGDATDDDQAAWAELVKWLDIPTRKRIRKITEKAAEAKAAESEERIKALEDALAKAETTIKEQGKTLDKLAKSPAPGGPVLVPATEDVHAASERDRTEAEIDRLNKLADQAQDPSTREAYRALAQEKAAELKASQPAA
ncbi:MAG TPA: hypothetical protein VMT43_11605 [Acidimicrobiales bacterium]|nr:hypothetical protein [Acidimicrobiales bacterium]